MRGVGVSEECVRRGRTQAGASGRKWSWEEVQQLLLLGKSSGEVAAECIVVHIGSDGVEDTEGVEYAKSMSKGCGWGVQNA